MVHRHTWMRIRKPTWMIRLAVCNPVKAHQDLAHQDFAPYKDESYKRKL